jgi:hypothetical protein
LQTDPNGFHARLAIAFAAKKSAKSRYQANNLIEARRRFGDRLIRQNIGGLPFIAVEA